MKTHLFDIDVLLFSKDFEYFIRKQRVITYKDCIPIKYIYVLYKLIVFQKILAAVGMHILIIIKFQHKHSKYLDVPRTRN